MASEATNLADVIQGFMARLQINPDDLPDEPEPEVCAVCNGTGLINYNVRWDDPRFGKLYPCPANCETVIAQRRAMTERLMAQSAWAEGYDLLTFGSFQALVAQYDNGWAGKRGGYAVATAFAESGGQEFSLNDAARRIWNMPWRTKGDGVDPTRLSNSVVLTGDVGTGKTGLAVAVVNALREQGHPVLFMRTLSIVARIQDTYGDAATHSTDDVLREFSTVSYLIIDEFTAENLTNDRLEKIEQIIRERDRRGLPTLYTTNHSIEEVYAKWGKRTGDIVAEAHWVAVGGVKLRQTTRKAAEAW